MFILESFDLDPLMDYPGLYFNTDDSLLYESLMEEAQGATKGNILQKLWKMIQIAFEWLVKAFGGLIKFIKGLFNRNKRSIDEIVEEMDIQPKRSSSKDQSSDGPKINIVDSKNSSREFKANFKNKPFKIFLKRKGEEMEISSNALSENGNALFSTDAMKYLTLAFKLAANKNEQDFENYLEKADYIIYKYATEVYEPDLIYKVSISKFEEINSQMLEINGYVDKYSDIFTDKNTPDKELTMHLTRLQNILLDLQRDVNQLQKSFVDMYILGQDYSNTINDIETLSQFIEKMVRSNISYDAISLNIITVYSGDLGDTVNIQNGLGRIVFFPKKTNSVLKIPYNGFGLSGNNNEYKTWNIVKNNNSFNIVDERQFKLRFARILNVTNNKFVIEMEKIVKNNKGFFVTDRDKKRVYKTLQEEFTKLGYPNIYTTDLHEENILIDEKNNYFIIIDYGMIGSHREVHY